MTGFRPLIVVLAMTGVAAPALAQDDVERENLTDVREINVIVEELAADAEAAGLTDELLDAAVERRLEERGVPLGNSRNAADLYITVGTHQGGSTGLYAYCVRVSVEQLVTIEGNQLRALVGTWDLDALGTVGAGNLPQVERVVLQIVDAFTEDYLAVNDPR